jgi:uncharacterized membrane protein YqjE
MRHAIDPDGGLARLGREVADDAVRLVRAEIDLAKAQFAEAARRLMVALALILFAAVLLLIGVIEMLGAVPSQFGPQLFGNAWLGWLAFGGIFVIVASLLVLLGTRAVRRSLSQGKQTVADFKEDAEWVKQLTRRSGSGS